MNRMPSLFVSHGAPTFAIEPGLAGPRLTALGRKLPRPQLDSAGAWAFGAALAPLAEAGVLIVGSGSLTHNLAEFKMGSGSPQDYAAEFAAWVRDAVVRGDSARLRQTLAQAPHARRAHPTTEHFLPLLVAAGAAAAALPAQVIEGGIAHGVLSMDDFLFGWSEPLSTATA
jgi:4,5-DOPA dioxygenase extradiol